MEFLRKGVLTKRQTINGQGQELVMTELNSSHPLVQEALPGFRGHVFDFDVASEESDGRFQGAFVSSDDYEDDEDNRGNLLSPGEARSARR
jgi:hypothetical protein